MVLATVAASNKILTSNSTLSGHAILHVKKKPFEKACKRIEVAITCEIRADTITKTELIRKDLLVGPRKFPRGKHKLDFELELGALDKYPSSLDFVEEVGVFWWLELCVNDKLCDQYGIGVFPSRRVDFNVLADLANARQSVKIERSIMITSANENAKPEKARPKALKAMIGEKYRHPVEKELRELPVDIKTKVPEAGVLQSPHKVQMGLFLKTYKSNRIALDSVRVKLAAIVLPRDSKPHEAVIDCFEENMNVALSTEWEDVSHYIAGLEIPPVSETMETNLVSVHYELRVTIILRAINLHNLSHWKKIAIPVKVLPSVIEQFGLLPSIDDEISPPPYAVSFERSSIIGE